MAALLRTALVAIASSATTALVFSACAMQDRAAPTTAPAANTAPPPATLAAPAASAPAPWQLGAASAAQPATGGVTNPATVVYQRNGASVVNITSLAALQSRAGGQQTQPQGIGTGFIVDDDGRIVTNSHVVQQADQISVTFQDRTTVPARLLGRDADNDLAVIQVDPESNDPDGRPLRDRIRPVALADSDQVVIGEPAVAIGSPLGLQQTVTQGIVSARRNPGEESLSRSAGSLDLLGGAIQTDAAINPGNSGGPLFNAAGEVIGVNTAILSQSGGNEGVGFAIPINVVRRVAPELIQTGRYRHPLVGVTTAPLAGLSPQIKQQLGLDPSTRGLLVQEVTAGAQQAGVQAGSRRANVGNDQIVTGGDIIIAVDGQPVVTGGDLRGYVENNKRPGEQVTLTVLRNGQRVEAPVTLSERPQP